MHYTKDYKLNEVTPSKLILDLPGRVVISFIGLTLVLFTFSPMLFKTPNLFLTYVYAGLVLISFKLGYSSALKNEYQIAKNNNSRFRVKTENLRLLYVLVAVPPFIFYGLLLVEAIQYYGFSKIGDIFADLGANYSAKDELIDQMGETSVSQLHTILNLISFTQVSVFVFLTAFWSELNKTERLIGIAAGVVQALYYLTIGTMSGMLYLLVFLLSGLLIRKGIQALKYNSGASLQKEIRKAMPYLTAGGIGFFILMVVILAARAERVTIYPAFRYDQDSVVYGIFGNYIGDGFGVALAYVAQGWHGLGNTFEVDFEWTYGLSFGRALHEYYVRFLDVQIPSSIPSYPVRQQAITGYPAYVHWFTIYPWLASDFTFIGALVLNWMFAYAYGRSWLKAVSQRCVVNMTLFALLNVGCIFISANSQLLDSKTFFLALVAIALLMPLRRSISSFIYH